MQIQKRAKRLEKITREIGRQGVYTEDTLRAELDNCDSDMDLLDREIERVKEGTKKVQMEMGSIRFYESI